MAPNNVGTYPLMILDIAPPVKPPKAKPKKKIKPFWTKKSSEWSGGLPLCGFSDLTEVEREIWGSSDTDLASGSWFSVRMKSPVLPPAVPGNVSGPILDKLKEQAKEPLAVRVKKILVIPTPDQKLQFVKFFNAVRFCYNVLVEKFPEVWKGGVTLKGCRDHLSASCPEWLSSVPFVIKDCAVRDFVKARKAHFAKLEKAKKLNPSATNFATFKFRSKTDPSQTFDVHSDNFYREKGMFAFLNLRNLKTSEPVPDRIGHSVKFIMYRDKTIYLDIPTDVPLTEPLDQTKTIALDPGVRTFQTTYDSDGKVSEWGAGDMTRIVRLCIGIDRLQAKWSKESGKKRRSMKKAWGRAIRKVQNLVKDLHCKLAKWLCENYKVILIPEFETQKMVRKGKRKINSGTARAMTTWSHFAFRQRLLKKAESYDSVRVIVCDEQFTSKTCGKCGNLNANLRSSKLFQCPDRQGCGHIADRDANAARNIMIRYLTLKRCKII